MWIHVPLAYNVDCPNYYYMYLWTKYTEAAPISSSVIHDICSVSQCRYLQVVMYVCEKASKKPG